MRNLAADSSSRESPVRGKGAPGAIGPSLRIVVRAGLSFCMDLQKSERENTEPVQLRVMRELGAAFLAASEEQIARTIEIGELEEIAYDCQQN